MFDLLAKILCSVATFLFPVFASYKALKANDPSQLTPWLMYWVVIACILVVESWTGWILCWFPFYQEIRAGFMLWLVLPQFQGATRLYVEHVHPTLDAHEREIEEFITRTHDQAKAAGVEYIRKLIDYAREALFGTLQQAHQAAIQSSQNSPPPEDPTSFVQNLFTRWRVPPITPYAPQMATDFYHFLSSALQQQEQRNPAVGDGMPNSATLIPPGIEGKVEKTRFIELQRERLKVVMAALDQEMNTISGTGEPVGGTSIASVLDVATGAYPSEKGKFFKSPSSGNMSGAEGDFDHVTMSDAASESSPSTAPTGKWLWAWGKPQPSTPSAEKKGQ